MVLVPEQLLQAVLSGDLEVAVPAPCSLGKLCFFSSFITHPLT